MKQRKEQYSWEGIEVTVIRKSIRNLILRVRKPDAEVMVSAPPGVSASYIQKFVISRKEWIGRHRDRILRTVPPAEKQYITGEIHLLFGKEYHLRMVETPGLTTRANRVIKSTVEGDEIVISVPLGAEREKRMALLYSFYAAQLAAEIPAMVARWETVMGVRVERTGLRKMKTRWGSCNRAAARIMINSELARCPIYLTEYIVVHEMVHLFEGGHNKRFYSFMDRFLPEWRNFRKELRKFPL
ncbi:MAG: M48 family metallopeptidase [Bacteroidales bacterium]|nr:M48 family metallopeptidase [Bacteroidales bacterium]